MTAKFKTTGKYFRQKRIDADLSQEDVAGELKYETSQMVSNWERGICLPPNNKLLTLTKLYKISRKEVIDLYLAETRRDLEKSLKMSR